MARARYNGAMLYTRRGDGGETGTFGCDQKISKSSPFAEALGAVDEINSLLGLVKVKAATEPEIVKSLERAQQNLFIIQAELAGAKQTIKAEALGALEKVIDEIERELPPITSFFVAGGTELATLLDYARTVARRAERRAWLAEVEAKAVGGQSLGQFSLAYLNRLSSLLYALARRANHKADIKEQAPRY